MRNNSLRILSIITFITLLTCVYVDLSYSYNTSEKGPGGHDGLTEKSLRLKKSLHAGENLDKELSEQLIDKIKKATSAEDAITWQQAKKEIFPPWMRHFYNPITGKGLPYFETARERAKRFYDSAVNSFCAGNKQKAWDDFGHALHLLQDMGSPSHVHKATHAFQQFYPTWGLENYVSNNWPSLSSQIVAEDCELIGGINDYIHQMALYTHSNYKKYDQEVITPSPISSDSTCIPYPPSCYTPSPVTKGEDPYPNGPYSTIALLNKVVGYSAGLIDTFWNDVYVNKCSPKLIATVPGRDNPDDTYEVSIPLEYEINEAEYQWINMRLVTKKGRIGHYWAYLYGNKYQEIYNLPSDTSNETIAQKFVELKDIENLLTSYPYNETEDTKALPDVAILSNGYSKEAVRFLFKEKETARLIEPQFSIDEIKNQPVFIIPSGGLYGLENSEMFKSSLAEYVKDGGTLIVFAQQHGYEFSVLPVPQEEDGSYKTITGYGWTEDQSCQSNSSYIDTYHQILSGQNRSTPSLNVDGYFSNYPSNATVLLRRTVNSQPAMIMYDYGLGKVLVTSMYSDWAYGHSQASKEEIALVRDMISWAKKPDQLPEIKQSETVSVSLSVKNNVDVNASSVKYFIYNPDRTTLLLEETHTTSIPPGQSLIVPVSYTTSSSSELGIYHIDYELYDIQGNVIQPNAETDSGRFVVSNPPSNPYKSPDFNFTVNSDSEYYVYGSDAAFTVTIWNNSDTDRTVTTKYCMPHHYLETGDPQYGGWIAKPELMLTETLLIPANGSSSFTHIMNNARASLDRFWAYFYNEDNKNIGVASKGFFVVKPLVEVSLQTDKAFYIKGGAVNFTINLQSKNSISYATILKVKVIDPSNTSIYSDSLPVTLSANGTATQNLSFTLPPTAQNGLYIVSAETFDGNGKKIGGNSTSFEVPSAMLSISPTLPATFAPNASFQTSFEVKNIWVIDVSAATLKVDFIGPSGNTLFTNTEQFDITSGQAKTLIYNVPTGPGVFGNYRLKYLLTYAEKVASGEIIISRSYTIQNTFDKITYSASDTVSAIISITNTGKFQEEIPLKVEIPEFNYSNTTSISALPQQTITQPFSIPIPGNAISGKYTLIVTLGTTSITKAFDFYVPESKLELSGQSGAYSAGDNIPIILSNTGGGGTNYELNVTFTDTKGIVVSNQILSGTISAKETKAHNVSIPSGIVSGQYILKLTIKDTTTNKITSLNSTLSVTGISGTLSIRTEKDVYLDTEGVRAITDIASTGMSIPDAELNLKVIFAMKTSTVRGTVINAETSAPIQGAKISIGDRETYTTSQGEYALLNVSPGLQTINITYPGFDRATSSINVFEGSQTYDALLSPSEYGTLKGTITDSMIGEIIVGAKVELIPREVLSSDAESRISYSNFEAIFEIKLPIGTYTLRITKEDYQLFTTEILITEGLNENQFSLTKTNIQPPTTGELTGKVIDNLTDDILLGVEVKLDSTLFSRVQMNEQTYHFYDISPGSHTLSVNYAGYDRFETTREIVAGQQSYDILLTPSLYGNLTGTVKDASTENSIVGAKIEITPLQVASSDQSSIILHSDFTGSYTLNNSPAGTYTVKVTKQYYSELNTTVTIQEGTSTLDIDLQQVEQIQDINEIEPNNNISQATLLNIEENGLATIYPTGDSDYYKVTVPSNGTIEVTVSDIPGSHYYQLYLYNSAGTGIANTGIVSAPGPATLSKFVDQGGDYYVQVRDYYNGNSTLPYRIRVEFVPLDGDVYMNEPNGSIATATTLPLDKTERGYIYFTNDSDYYKVTIPSNGTIEVTVSDIPGSHYYQLYLYNSAGTGIANTGIVSAPGPATLSKFVDQGGDYYVQVRDYYNGNSTSLYRIYTTFTPQDLPAERVIFEKTIPPLSLSGSQTLNEDIPAMGMTGKFFVTSTLKSSTSQVIAKAEYPFYTIKGDTILLFNTDKKLYKSGDTITIAGEVQNHAAIAVSGITLTLSQLSASVSQDLYSATFDIPANGIYPFTIITIADIDGTYTLTGKVTHGNSTLVEISDHYEVTSPNVTTAISAPEIAGNEPFNIEIELKNEGLITAIVNLQSSIDTLTQTVTIPAGETRLIQYSQQITNDTTCTFTFTGDLTQTITKTVIYGLGASIAVNPLTVYPEGRIEVPVTIVNAGQLDENLTLTFSLQPSGLIQSKTYYVAKGGSVTDTLYYDLTEGNYQLSATSQQPTASNQASFLVRKENKVEIAVSAGAQTNELIPVTVNLTNLGYNEVSGSMNLDVSPSGSGQTVWSGSQAVTQLSSQNSQPFTFNINPSAIETGNYTLKAEFFNDSGQQLGIVSSHVTIYGPIFQITQLPPYQTFTVGGEATFTFKVKNTGNKEGAFDFNFKIYDLVDSTKKEWLMPDEEKPITFSSMLSIDLEEKDYYADYELKGQGSGTKGQVKYHLEGINLSVDANLDKQYYNEGETANLTLSIQSQGSDSPSLFARVNYNGYEELQPFILNGTETLTFDIPLTQITGEKLFYGIYHGSGRSIHLNSLYIYKAGDVLTITTDKQVYNPGENVSMTVNSVSGAGGTLTLSAPDYSETFSFTGTATKSFTLPGTMTAGTYNISYELTVTNGETYTGSHPFDVAGISVKVKEATLDKVKYATSDNLNLGLTIESNQSLLATLKAWIVDPEEKYVSAGEQNINLSSSDNLVITHNSSFVTAVSGIHRLVYGIYSGDLLLVSGSEAFDVGGAVLTGISTDKTDYLTNTEVVKVTVSMFGIVDANLELQLDGNTIRTQTVSLNGFSTLDIDIGTVEPGQHILEAVLNAGGLKSTKETTFTYALSILDSDNDGMPDEWETAHGLDPNNPDADLDPDNDELTNLQEYQHSTSPNNPDTDNDGMPDGWEVTYGLNPNADDASSDKDNDGFSNLQEYQSGSSPSDPNIIPNQLPIANAGADQNVITGTLVTLNGTESFDPEGAMITFLWKFIEVPAESSVADASLSDITSAMPTFTPDISGTYRLELIVNDGVLESASDEVVIIASTPNVPPNANAGPDQNVSTGATVYLDGSDSNDLDNGPQPLSYLWNFDSVPNGSSLTNNNINNRDQVSASFIPDIGGSYVINLTVNDGELSSWDTLNIIATIPNVPPNANAGLDITIPLDQTAVLDGSASNDPDNGPSPLYYSWIFVTVPAGSQIRNEDIIGVDSVSPSFTPDMIGTYVLQLTVSDGLDMSFDNVAVTVSSQILTLVLPNGGDVIPSGGIYGICWEAPNNAVKFDLEYSLNNGTSWNFIKSVPGLNCTHWEEVPVVTANKKKCRVKVIGYDSNGTLVGEDISDKPFTIEVLKVTSPNGRETLKPGDTSTIQWTTYKTIRAVAKTALKYTTNGTTWKAIKTLSGNLGSFNWKVPDASSRKCKVKVILKDEDGANIGTDISNNFFTIQP